MDKIQIDNLADRLAKLSLDQRKNLFSRIRKVIPAPRLSKYCPATISPKQEAFLLASQDEVLFGGAAGGGKTGSLLLGALQYADCPDYSALLLRRTMPELKMPKSLIWLSLKWLSGTGAVWHKQDSKWTFAEGGELWLRYLDRDDDKWQYQSAAFDYIGIDEAAEFPQEETYEFLFSRIRRQMGSQIPGRMRLGANPIGPGAVWLKKRFITSKNPARLFIPSKLDDNPFIDKDEYRTKSLSKLPPHIRLALEDGDWDAKPPGKMFRREWFKLTPHAPLDISGRVRFWDLAATEEDRKKNPSWTCGLRMSYANEAFYIEHVIRVRETPGKVKEIVRHAAEMDGTEVEIHIEQEPGSSGIAVVDDYVRALPGYVVKAFKLHGSKELRAAPFASQAEAGHVFMVSAPWNEDYVEEMEQFPSAKAKNDQVDSSSGAFQVFVNGMIGGEEPIQSFGSYDQPDW